MLPLRKLHGRIKYRIEKWKYIHFPLGTKLYVLGTPTHTNIGDSAIVIAEKDFLIQCGISAKRIKEITVNDYNAYEQVLLKQLRANRKYICCLQGGGNFGDQWIFEELFRRRIMESLTNKIIVFPQTIFYTDTESGKKEEERSKAIYSNKPNLTLVARDKSSYELMNRLYSNTRILLSPDIVLSLNIKKYNLNYSNRKGIMLCIRNDAEKKVSDSDWDYLKDSISKQEYYVSDMHADSGISKENREEIVRTKLQEFSSSKLVITDRLHAMIFAAITGTPCIALGNYNYKVSGTYEWIDYLPYIKYADNMFEVITLIPDLLKMETCKFDIGPLHNSFTILEEEIKKVCRKSV